ncbi:hypothetical protein CA267_001715 [Alteromonas pelagimontana]|uniref:DUF2163 domain-containing protein n=1 Tax=Alteromonas pelagimontana TaxID=1858656 RepID=A0A6M4M8U6_9ALTE|nr:hypothetical protein [Alteromonas pelagimontana]QJR79602.1 hypothetical protein CA267_001715 [Alteromonas pelagimontana]
MIPLSTSQLDRLKRRANQGRTSIYLIKMKIAGTWYRLTDADMPITYNFEVYHPGYLNGDDIDDFETTSDPKTNDITIPLDANEKTFVALFLGSGWMNGEVIVYEHHRDDEGEIFTKNVYQGLLDDFSISEEKRQIDVNAASIWSDFEKTSGIRTNTASQQRFYPDDTGFRHVSKAQRKIYWGKEAPISRTTYTGGRVDKPVGANLHFAEK